MSRRRNTVDMSFISCCIHFSVVSLLASIVYSFNVEIVGRWTVPLFLLLSSLMYLLIGRNFQKRSTKVQMRLRSSSWSALYIVIQNNIAKVLPHEPTVVDSFKYQTIAIRFFAELGILIVFAQVLSAWISPENLSIYCGTLAVSCIYIAVILPTTLNREKLIRPSV